MMSYQKMDKPAIDMFASAHNQAFKQDHVSERTCETEPSDDECEWDIITVDGIQYIVSGDRRYKLQDLVPIKD